MCTLCTGVYDEQDNDKGTISLFLSDTSANASGSILCLYEHMNALRCKISFLCSTLWARENRKIERGRLDTWVSKVPRQEPLDADIVHKSWSVIVLWVLVATPTQAGAQDYSEGLVPQYFDVSFYIVKLLLYNLIQTVVFEKCNIQFLPCTLRLQFLMYCYFPK